MTDVYLLVPAGCLSQSSVCCSVSVTFLLTITGWWWMKCLPCWASNLLPNLQVGRKDAKWNDCFLTQLFLPLGDLMKRCCSALLIPLLSSTSRHFISPLFSKKQRRGICLPRYRSCWNPHQICNPSISVGNIICILREHRQIEVLLRKCIKLEVWHDISIGK